MGFSLFSQQEKTSTGAQKSEYWLSYSDLMAGLLMIFALILMMALYQESKRECQMVVYEATSDTLQSLIESRQRVVRGLQEQFGASDRVTVDSVGAVKFAGSLLFDQASAEISSEGRRELASFAKEYFPLLLSDAEFRSQLKRIIVEGHTNDDGSYELNLALSHNRSLAVMVALLEAAEAYRSDLEQLVTANGRSFADLVFLPDGRVDKAGSRRIEIQFQMDDQTLSKRVLELGAILIDPECDG